MRKILILACALAAVPAWALPLNLYNDSLFFSDDAIVASCNWDNDATWLHWNISLNGDRSWHYEYTWHTDGSPLTRMLLEVSAGGVPSDFWDWSGPISVGLASYSTGGRSDPGLPGEIYALSINANPSVPVFSFAFDTWRAPLWGDFYVKDGWNGDDWTVAYNAGFLATDANDGFHIARPDGVNRPRPVPDGGVTLLLLGTAMLGVELLRRRLRA